MALQNVDHFKDIKYAEGITYGELLMQNEQEMSFYNLVGSQFKFLSWLMLLVT